MYNPVINPTLTKAKYTKIYNECVDEAVMEPFVDVLDEEYESIVNPDNKLEPLGYHCLFDEILEKYRYYEICNYDDNDVSVFTQLMLDIFHEWKHYFIQLALNYYKEYDYAVGNRKRVMRSDKTTGNRDSSSANVTSDSNKTYDLPHKEVNDTTSKGYMTDRNDNDSTSENASNVQTEGTFDSEVETIYDNEFLDLKRKYINQIRNVNDEFADKFSECFIHIFG